MREITQLDSQVGQLMHILDETGQRENTLVLFLSEQGSSFPYAGKWSIYDNGIRTASLVRWPGKVKPGSVSDALMQYVDVPPTFLAAAGADPTGIDTGCAVAPYPMRAVRDTRYKLIRNLAPENRYSISGLHEHAMLIAQAA